MPRSVGRLAALTVERVKEKPGMHADGGGLYLQVKNGGAPWILRYQLNGQTRYMGLGPLALFGLKDARAEAQDRKRLRHAGAEPLEPKRQARRRARRHAAKA